MLTDEYGVFVFVFQPFLLGILPPWIVGRRYPLKSSQGFALSGLCLLLATFLALLLGTEGMICLLMYFPISIPLVLLGSYLGYRINKKRFVSDGNAVMILIALSFLTMGFDEVSETSDLIPVTTAVEVDAPIAEVWNNVVTFDSIPEPVDRIFKTGVSYPTDATIQGRGEGAIRYCNFTTGSFVEPITNWDEPHLLQFDVIEQPIPMNEMNPFWDIHPKHLDGYFLSKKGQFRLTALSENKTFLEGTTWYTLDITPVVYWRQWSDFIIHRIHRRVLNHIKLESERK